MTETSAHPYVMMARNNACADARLYHVLCDLPDGVVSAPRPGFFASLSQTMTQIHHRGQAHVHLPHAGIAPPQLDAVHLNFDHHDSAAEDHP